MKRRDFTIGLLLAAGTRSAPAQERVKQHRIAIIRPAGPVFVMSDTGHPFWRAFFEELRRLGDVEGENLTVERYSGEGKPEGFADLAREAVSRNPDVTVALGEAVARAARATNGSMPIVWMGAEPIDAGLAASLARPGGNITGVTIYPGAEIWGKRLQILKEAVPSASKIAYLDIRVEQSAAGQEERRKASERLQISLIYALLEEPTASEVQRVLADITQERADAVMVSGTSELTAHQQLIVKLIEKSRLPAIYASRDYVAAGGLMAYGVDPGDLERRMADDVHQILSGAKPSDIPIYQPTKFEFLVNLKAANALGLAIPPSLLALADEVIE
jgi:putative tryptophan/tyrosine transport system substrate-binding protein